MIPDPNQQGQGVEASQHNPHNQGAPTAPLTEEQQLQQQIEALLEHALTPLRQELAEKEMMIGQLNQKLSDVLAWNTTVQEKLDTLTKAQCLQGPTIHARPPDSFTGNRNEFEAWVSQLNLFFGLSAHALPTNRDRVLYACSLIKGPAYAHVKELVDSAVTENPQPAVNDYDLFFANLRTIFAPVDQRGEAQRAIHNLTQKGNWSVEQYAAEFKRWMHTSQFDDQALRFHFYRGLQEKVRILLVPEISKLGTINELILRAAELDSGWRTAKQLPTNHAIVSSAFSAPPPSDPNAMDIGRMQIRELQRKVPRKEWSRRLRDRACLNCGQKGHRLDKCEFEFSAEAPQTSDTRIAMATTPPAAATPSPAPTPSSSAPTLASQDSVNRILALLEKIEVSKAEEAKVPSSPGF